MTQYEKPNDLEEFAANNLLNPNLKGYIFFWVGQLVSILGSNITHFAIIWWIAIETKSAFYLSFAVFLAFIPKIILTPFAGVLVDRWSRKKIIGTVDSLQSLAALILIYLFIIDIVKVWYILLILALQGSLQAFHEPAVQAIIPLLVPRDKLNRINSLDYLMGGIIYLIGPIIAAVLLELLRWEIYEILWIDVITFLIAVIPLVLVKIPSVKKDQREVEEKPSFKKEFKEGLFFIKEKKGLLSLLTVFTAANFFIVPLFILLPLIVIEVHDGGPHHLALLLSLQEIGTILGALFISAWKGFKRNVLGVSSGIFFAYLGILMVAVAPKGNFWFMGAGTFLIGVVLSIVRISNKIIWQTVVPPELLGRVFSVSRTLGHVTVPIAMILAGLLAEIIGIITFVILLVVIGIISLTYSWFMTDLSLVDETLETHENTVQTLTEEQVKPIDFETIPPEFI